MLSATDCEGRLLQIWLWEGTRDNNRPLLFCARVIYVSGGERGLLCLDGSLLADIFRYTCSGLLKLLSPGHAIRNVFK